MESSGWGAVGGYYDIDQMQVNLNIAVLTKIVCEGNDVHGFLWGYQLSINKRTRAPADRVN